MGRLRERAETIRAVMAEHYDVRELAFVSVVCNRCGRVQIVDGHDIEFAEKVTADWQLGEYGEDADYCPECK